MTTKAQQDELARIDKDTRMMLYGLVGRAGGYFDNDDAESLRWLHRRVSKLAADVQNRRREAVQS